MFIYIGKILNRKIFGQGSVNILFVLAAFAVVFIALLFFSSPAVAEETGYRIVVTTDSQADGWNSASLTLHYNKTQKMDWDIENDISKGNEITKEIGSDGIIPYGITLRLDFGGGMTVRHHSGRVKFYAMGEEILNEEYSVWSSPFSSSDAEEIFTIFGISPAEVTSPEGETTTWPLLKKAFDAAAANSGSTIKLLEDTISKYTVEITNAVTLDLNGYNICSSEDSALFKVKESGRLKIIDSSPKREHESVYVGTIKSDVIVNGGSVYPAGSKENGGAINVEKGGELTVTGGTFLDCHSYKNGGAIYCEGKLAMDGTKFIACTAQEKGGAVYVDGQDTVKLDNLRFTSCSAAYGGALYLTDTGENFDIRLNNSSFSECNSEKEGGAVKIEGDTDISSTGLSFFECTSEDGGAVFNASSKELSMSEAEFINCTASGNGGGLYYNGMHMKLNNCTFSSCSAQKDGGGLYLLTDMGGGADVVLDASKVKNCSADKHGGGLYIDDDGSSTKNTNRTYIQNSSVENNTSNEGGGIYAESHFVYLIDSKVTGNSAVSSNGGGIYVDSMRDIDAAGLVVIRDNTAGSSANNLCLQNGVASSAKLYSGGLYDGSYIGISSTSGSRATVGINLSQYQKDKYLHADESSRGLSMTNTKEVSTPVYASIITENFSLIVIIAGVIALASAIVIFVLRKRRKGAED